MTDDEFLLAFEECSLPQAEWTHRAHVRMAWLRLRRAALGEALTLAREGIQRYNATLDKTLAYHETITQAFMIVIDERMRRDGEASFDEFCARHPDLLDSKLSALLRHYRQETLFSMRARETFVAPDLEPFP
jgi:hypothetical protein